MTKDFAGRRALVTGGASGIGQSMARELLDRGAHVICIDLEPSGAPAGCEALGGDVSDPSFVAAVHDAVGHVDVLMNNAGIGSTSDVLTCTVTEWDRLFAVNVRSVFLWTQAFLPGMLAAGRGSIVNTASIAGLVGLRDRAAYCASKGAVISLTKQVAIQYAGTGVRCNCICPGTVDSPWVDRLLAEADDPAAARQTLVARQPIGRLGTPAEVAAAAVYLASDAAAFITGTALVIDGGLVAG